MKAEVVVVGDELIAGRVVDTNSATIARALLRCGVEVGRVIRVGDDEAAIKRSVASALVSSRLVFVIGGLGPTSDDLTLRAVSRLLDRKVVLDRNSLKQIRAQFAHRRMAVPALAKRQAFVLSGAKVFPNPVGMVPGSVIEHQGSIIVLLPGVPAELKALIPPVVFHEIGERFGGRKSSSEVLRTFGLIESRIAPRVTRLARRYSVQVGFYPSLSGLDILFTGKNEKEVKECADRVAQMLGRAVFARDERSLSEVLGSFLLNHKLTVATAESCTGGLIGDLLTNIAGSSRYYRGGVIAYSNQVKIEVLGVRESTINRFGAVSSPTVREMAEGVCLLLGSEVGIAASGIAGPSGGSKEKPVGLVYIGVKVRDRVKVERRIFTGDRRAVKERSAYSALDLCRRFIQFGG
ncbi:MAG: CinA family nicotinamide mononucleotide deamidase-related protein [bacterium]